MTLDHNGDSRTLRTSLLLLWPNKVCMLLAETLQAAASPPLSLGTVVPNAQPNLLPCNEPSRNLAFVVFDGFVVLGEKCCQWASCNWRVIMTSIFKRERRAADAILTDPKRADYLTVIDFQLFSGCSLATDHRRVGVGHLNGEENEWEERSTRASVMVNRRRGSPQEGCPIEAHLSWRLWSYSRRGDNVLGEHLFPHFASSFYSFLWRGESGQWIGVHHIQWYCS